MGEKYEWNTGIDLIIFELRSLNKKIQTGYISFYSFEKNGFEIAHCMSNIYNLCCAIPFVWHKGDVEGYRTLMTMCAWLN
jgi:hypothetical protein